MINRKALNNLNKGINSVPCPLCGGRHSVAITQNSTHDLAQSRGDMMLLPSGDRLFVAVEDGFCEGFKQHLNKYIIANLIHLIENPFDRIP